MSWRRLEELLQKISSEINLTNNVESPQSIWERYGNEIADLQNLDIVADQFVNLSQDLASPKAAELARLLLLLKQRRQVQALGKRLVGRIRVEVSPRQRPPFDVPIANIAGELNQVARIGQRVQYSNFQVEGWNRVLQTIRQRNGLVVVAPTGAGKTEVFVLPLIHEIVQSIRNNRRGNNVPHFILLYPRVELLKDQLARIFRYVYWAEQTFLQSQQAIGQRAARVDNGIVIGFQFSGIESDSQKTLNNAQIFDGQRYFRIVPECPICRERNESGRLVAQQKRNYVTPLRCDNSTCGAEFKVTLSKPDHVRAKPHIMVTTYESLDRFYLTPTDDIESYLRLITGIVFDEAHLYYSLQGVHLYNLINNIENLQRRDTNQRAIAKIASSATISNPQRFIAKLFYGSETQAVTVHDAADFQLDPAGLEVIYFVQSPDEERSPGASSTLIQSVMAIGHGLFNQDERAIVFTDSVDNANRLQAQIQDAESNKRLWAFRTILGNISYLNNQCPNVDPLNCNTLYLNGECWRGIIGGSNCTQAIQLREQPLGINCVSSKNPARYWDGQVVVATPSLEVGVDDDRIKATFHYRPPRTVFSFIQRRGRAGRRRDDVAYSIMILGNDASDQFYFFRRNRLLSPRAYELPLNPQNPTIRAMHEMLAAERVRLRTFIQRFRPQRGILEWIFDTLARCPAVSRLYGTQLNQLRNLQDSQTQQQELIDWIEIERSRFEVYLNVRWTLEEIQDECPDNLQVAAREIRELVDRFLRGETGLQDDIQTRLQGLDGELTQLIYVETEQEAIDRLQALRNKSLQVWQTLRDRAQTGLDPQLSEGFYDFFRTLSRFCERDKRQWILNYAPDVLKTVLQAFFYLGLSTDELDWHRNCQSCVKFFIPDAFFQQVKPLVVAIRTSRPNDEPRLEQERVSDLTTLFFPYKTFYRYFNPPYLSTVETEHRPDWVVQQAGETVVRLRLRGEGLRRNEIFMPQKVYVRAVRGDEEGDGVVKICPSCYAIYSENRRSQCHSQNLIPVKLRSEPIIRRVGRPTITQPISRTLSFLELEGNTTVIGSQVDGIRVVRSTDRYVPIQGSRMQFRAEYLEHVSYTIPTKGIAWDLSNIVNRILSNDMLRQQLREFGKDLTPDLILHTAAHMLYKAIAAISGVNEDVLEYTTEQTTNRVMIWERYDGGAGISEIIRDSIRTNPITLYRELLASTICPINLEEQNDWDTSENLRQTLAERWLLPADDEFLTTVTREAAAERQARLRNQEDTQSRSPSCEDGCPVCIRVTWCTERDQQETLTSRTVAGEILRRLIRRVDAQEAESLISESTEQGIITPTILFTEPTQRVSDVLLL